jgi:hypothetical protein
MAKRRRRTTSSSCQVRVQTRRLTSSSMSHRISNKKDRGEYFERSLVNSRVLNVGKAYAVSELEQWGDSGERAAV